MYGEWVWHDLYGYVWRPFYNDYYPSGNWAPYIYGNWASYQNQLFWIPGEPWGWVPYHLGIWMWDKNKGWLWLPGSMFAPAWAVWDFYFGYYFWRPWTLFDWYDDAFYMAGFYYGGYQFGYYFLSRTNPPAMPPANVLYSIRKDQLKKKATPSLPLPKEMKNAYKLTVAALKKGDQSALASLQAIPRQTAFVKRGDLSSPKMQEKIINFEQFLKQRESLPPSERTTSLEKSQDVSRDALRNIERSRIISELKARYAQSSNRENVPLPAAPLQDNHFVPGKITPPSQVEAPKNVGKVEWLPPLTVKRNNAPALEPPLPPPYMAQSSFRFRDWNPDVKTAVQLGVDISYSSRNNEIRCPQLGLSSLDRGMNPGIRLTDHGVSSYSGSDSSSSRSSSGASSSGTSGSHSSGASKSHESGGGGGKVKN
jgi:uncharacterized membrane protein YgcG